MAYLIANLAGNPNTTKDDVRKILDSLGAEVEEDKLLLMFKEMEGKGVTELLAVRREKCAYVASGGGMAEAHEMVIMSSRKWPWWQKRS